MTGAWPRPARFAGAILTVTLALWLLHPWTVRPINVTPNGSAPNDGADPIAITDQLWSTTLLPAIVASAVDARTVVDALRTSPKEARAKYGRTDGSGGWYVTVRGRGRIVAIDRSSSTGVATIDLAPYNGHTDVMLQIGPVIRGSAVRDATDLVPFSQFPNQLAYADAANALNAHVAKGVIEPITQALVEGRECSFVAAGSTDLSNDRRLDSLVPVQLSVETSNHD